MFPNQEPEPFTKLDLDKPAEQPNASVPAAERLQFRTAEIPGSGRNTCSQCATNFNGEYYHVAGATTCPACAEARIAERERKGTWAEFGRSALFGFGAAAAGSALYAIVSYATNMQFSLLAIVVGIMVGKAVLMGSRGIRGRRFQVLAVMLTYGSITSSEIPALIAEIRKVNVKDAVEKKAAAEKPGGAVRQAAPKQVEAPPTAGQFVLAVMFLIGIALISPFFGLTSVSGLLGLVILYFGLMQAWRRTAADDTAIAGPYQPEAGAAATA